MTVDDLRRALANLPGDMRVLVEGYEPHESDTIERCVVLPRSDGGVAEGRNAAVVWAAPVATR